jgi:hypothetical protein
MAPKTPLDRTLVLPSGVADAGAPDHFEGITGLPQSGGFRSRQITSTGCQKTRHTRTGSSS